MSEREHVVAGWLRKRLHAEARFQSASSVLFSVLGLMALALFSSLFVGLCALVIGLISKRLGAGSIHLWWDAWAGGLRTYFVAATILAMLFFMLAGQWHRRRMEFHKGKMLWKSPLVGSGASAAVPGPMVEFILGGPRLVFAGLESVEKARRLWSADVDSLSPILVWLYRRKKKARVLELCREFPGLNGVRVLPQLREVPGVHWLASGSGVVFLSQELRDQLETLLQASVEIESNETEEAPAQEGADETVLTPDSETAQWYETLGLSPFVPFTVVKRQYRQLAKIHHPDLTAGGEERSGDDARIRAIIAAYNNIRRRAREGGYT